MNETVELLQGLIRNACVNDGTPGSGHEVRNADLLASFLEGSGLDVERYEAAPGRGSIVARREGSDPSAPTLLLLGHTDVVPATGKWSRDPFAGELVDGFVWGRGAVDMLNLTAAMAVTARRLAREGGVRGSLVFLGVADEETNGVYGTDWLLREHPDAVRADAVLTEAGGFRLPLESTTGRVKLPMLAGEKGSYWCTVRVRGVAGHASTPLRTDNALVTAAEVVGRLAAYAPAVTLPATWRTFVAGLDLPEELAGMLVDPAGIEAFCATAEDLSLAREVHASTRTTIAPTMMQAGVKTNVIPDVVDLQLDVRTLPGQRGDDVRAMLREALGEELFDRIEIVADDDNPATESPTDTPLWDAMRRVAGSLVPEADIVPLLSTGATDARFYRRLGVPAYGAGLFSERISFADFGAMFHGDDERIDVESLDLSTEFFTRLALDFLGE